MSASRDKWAEFKAEVLAKLTEDKFGRVYGELANAKPSGDGWMLASVGPDRKADVDTDTYHTGEWQEILRGQDPQDIAEAKRLVYRFRHKKLNDERALDDEGDIVRTGGW